ncbi:MAG: hypothetical protein COB84_01890 [Rhodobacteraceae bacterium]|nr:MAG: hypothetical protein COB84_01890 [Paracoccaceae bacterium]
MTDSKGKSKDSIRVKAVKAATHDAMRAKMSFHKAIKAIGDAEQFLVDAINKTETQDEKGLSNAKIGAIRTLIDSKWKRIDKLLPSLKAVELSGDIGIRNVVRIVHLDGEQGEDDE